MCFLVCISYACSGRSKVNQVYADFLFRTFSGQLDDGSVEARISFTKMATTPASELFAYVNYGKNY